MDETLLELLQKVTLYDLIWSLLLVIFVGGLLISQKKRISKWMNKWRKGKNEEEDFTKLVFDLKNSVTELKQTVVQQSGDIQDLKSIVVKMQEKNSKTKRAEIKEKIERIYSECHPAKTCTDMQFETLKELIEEYEEHGGTNSFVHTTVEPEMYIWNKIKRIKEVNGNVTNNH